MCNFSFLTFHSNKRHIYDAGKGAGYCGVVHLHNVEWHRQIVDGAQVCLYVTPFTETNPVAKMTGHTDHRVRKFNHRQSAIV